MYNIRFLFILLGIIIGMSKCSPTQEISFESLIFPNTTYLKGLILDSSFVMGKSYDIDYYNQYILISAHTGEKEPLIHLFDQNEKKFFANLLPKGRGPGERLTWGGIQIDHITGEALFFDSEAQRSTTFQIDTIHNSKKKWQEQITINNFPVYAYNITPLENGYIAQGGGKVSSKGKRPRLSLIKNDSIIDILYNTPNVHFPENYLSIDKISTDFLYSISSDKQKLVCQMTYGMILEFFSIKKDRIIVDTVRGFIKPIFELDRHKCVNPIDGKTIYGLRDLYATNKYIYAIYIGNTVYKNSNRIAVFDWNGNPLHLFTTDYKLERLCVDEANKKIYATGVSPQYENVLLQFPLQALPPETDMP